MYQESTELTGSTPGFETALQGQAILQLPWGIPSNPVGSVQLSCAAGEGRMIVPCPSISNIDDPVGNILANHVPSAIHSQDKFNQACKSYHNVNDNVFANIASAIHSQRGHMTDKLIWNS